jgi:MRG-binding protein
MEMRESPDPSIPFLDTVEGEIAFFRSIMRARPIGLHRHFHVLSIRTVIHQDTGRYVTIDDIWEKLRGCYNIEALENLVRYVPQPLRELSSVVSEHLSNERSTGGLF